MTDQEIVRADIKELYLGNLGTVETDLELPRKGKHGSEITWRSEGLPFIGHDGRVARPAYGRGNREVTLVARFAYGGCAEEKRILVTVLEESRSIDAEEAFPIHVDAAPGETVYLPSSSAVRTKDGGVVAMGLEWEGGPERKWDCPGTYPVRGRLRDADFPVTGEVRIAAAEPPLPPVPKAEPCRDAVLLEGSGFYDAQERMHTYLLSTDPDQWLYNFRQAAGLDTLGAPPMTGWDAPEGLLRGHSTGHYLSALALCWRATGDAAIRRKAEYVVDALGQCQEAFSTREGFHPGFLSAYSEEQFDLLERYTPYPKIWAPYYTLHKILAGLLDACREAGIERAAGIAEKVGDWACARLSRLSHQQRKKMWGIYIAGEYGGINESLAELGRMTGDRKYLECAKYFDNDRLLYPLAQKADALDGMHANQHIPQIVGALKLFGLTGEARYYDAAARFWRNVTGSHMYANGGTGESEMFHQPKRIAGLLTKSAAESCATYNMLKLTSGLFRYRPDGAYMDYYERAVTNHTLSACDHRPTGGSTYFMPMAPKSVKDFDTEENSCCHGTGLESQFKYAENIYFKGEGEVYVNLYIPSRAAAEGLTLTLGTEGPEKARISVEAVQPVERTVLLRRPYWAGEGVQVFVDGAPANTPCENGYLPLRRRWEGRTEITIEFPCRVRYEDAPDGNCFTVHYGPYLLAALTEQEDRLAIRPAPPEDAFQRLPDQPLAFRCRENGIIFLPLERVWREMYQLYVFRA